MAALAPAPATATPRPKTSVAPVAPPSPALVSPTSSRLAVERVKATEPGRLEAEGDAEPGAKLRLTLNGSYLADVAAGVDGHWSLTIEHGMTPGLYALEARNTGAPGSPPARASFAYPQNPTPTSAPLVAARPADIVKPALEAKPVDVAAPETLKAPEARTEVAGAETPKEAPTKAEAPKPEPASTEPPKSALLPAEPPKPEPPREVAKADTPALAEPVKPAAVPSPLASAVPALSVPETPATAKSNNPAPRDPSHAVVARVRTTTVVYGDNLWDLARKFYNDGSRYSEIYAANSGQIRNPSLIYIGQVFVVPQGGPVKQ